jgi:acetyl-CoA carboxylase biotin carboxyl carrier protein
MNPNDLKELRELVDFLKENKIGEFDLERGDLKVRLKFESATAAAGVDMAQLGRMLASQGAGAAPAHAAPAAAPAAPVDEDAGLKPVKSPIVGTFYEAASPGAPPFVKVGDQVEVGTVLCIVEAMKLMNEIESDVAGEIVKLVATNGGPVEFGQPLYMVKPR